MPLRPWSDTPNVLPQLHICATTIECSTTAIFSHTHIDTAASFRHFCVQSQFVTNTRLCSELSRVDRPRPSAYFRLAPLSPPDICRQFVTRSRIELLDRLARRGTHGFFLWSHFLSFSYFPMSAVEGEEGLSDAAHAWSGLVFCDKHYLSLIAVEAVDFILTSTKHRTFSLAVM